MPSLIPPTNVRSLSQLPQLALLPLMLGVLSLSNPFSLQAAEKNNSEAKALRPNIVVIFCDDLGYGDLGCYGHPTIRTPNLDRMAAEGMRFTQFYSADSVCTPSRAALMTGRLPIRTGMYSDRRRVLFPDSEGGLQSEEVTVAEALRSAGYATACVGKWHLGHLPQYLPTNNGFDSYFGIPYSNDMLGRAAKGKQTAWQPLPLMRDEKVVEENPNQELLTERYTEESIKFIRRASSEKRPFFLYLPHNMPHTPIYASEKFAGQSARGLYGDVVETIDWSVGQILDTLRELKIADNTLVLFTSDNGPWLIQKLNGGSAGLLRDGKGCTWEGGMREPGIAWWPSKIPAGVVSQELASTLDLFPTACALAGVDLPTDRPYDGYDLSGLFLRGEKSPRQEMFYYRGSKLMAVRLGPWKAHYITQGAYGDTTPKEHTPPALYHLDHDPSENFDVSKDHADVLEKIAALVEQHRKNLVPGKSQLE